MNCASCADKLIPDDMVIVSWSYTKLDDFGIDGRSADDKYCPSCGLDVIKVLEDL